MEISPSMIFFAFVALFGIVFVIKSVLIVNQSDIYIVERLGKFSRKLHSGFHFLIPFVDRVANVVSTKEQLIDIPSQPVITKDNVNIQIDGIVFFTVQDGEAATYNVTNFKLAIQNLAITTLRSEIGTMDLDKALSARGELNAKILVTLDEAGANWGVKVTRIEISDISMSAEIQKAMDLQMKAERTKRAVELEAEGVKNADIRDAEAEKQREILKAEAIERLADAKAYEERTVAKATKEAIQMINESLQENQHAANYLLAKDKIAAWQKLAQNENVSKWIVPDELTSLTSGLGIIGDILSDKKLGDIK
jgi:regulator of protease activity HflC (stomatin/prohibitin superfamily)